MILLEGRDIAEQTGISSAAQNGRNNLRSIAAAE
jgi:hypothetical protein